MEDQAACPHETPPCGHLGYAAEMGCGLAAEVSAGWGLRGSVVEDWAS